MIKLVQTVVMDSITVLYDNSLETAIQWHMLSSLSGGNIAIISGNELKITTIAEFIMTAEF